MNLVQIRMFIYAMNYKSEGEHFKAFKNSLL